MKIIITVLQWTGWYMVIGFFILLIFELIISILKNIPITKEDMTAQFPKGIPANLRYLFFFFWPYILYYFFYQLPKQSRLKNDLDVDKTQSDFQAKLQKIAKENLLKKENPKKSNFQDKLEKMSKKRT